MPRRASLLLSLLALVIIAATFTTAGGTTPQAAALEAPEPDAPLNEHTLKPKTGLFFNDPRTAAEGGQANVKRLLVDRINATPPGATIRISTWNVSAEDNPVVTAVRAAIVRLVKVYVITGQANCDAVKSAFDVFAPFSDTWVHCVDGGGTDGQGMHMKMVAISETGKNADGDYDTVPYVTLIGSGNLTTGGWTNQWNDMFQYANRSDIYGWYVDRFNVINANRTNPKAVDYHFESDGDRARANFMPVNDATPTKDKDPVWDRLSGIPANGNTTIRVAMFASDLDRGQWLVNKLADMRAAGADIRFIAGPDVKAPLKGDLIRAGIPVVDGWHGDCTPETNPECEFVHLKMMTAKYWENGIWNYRSYTGSENWNWDGLTRNFEVTQRIGGSGVYENYNKLFTRIWNEYPRFTG